jgi:hypothetical protein
MQAIRDTLINSAEIQTLVGDKVWIAKTDVVLSEPCILLELRNAGKSDISHAHRRVLVHILSLSCKSNLEAWTMQNAIETALRSAVASDLMPIVYVEPETPYQITTEDFYGVGQSYLMIAKEK